MRRVIVIVLVIFGMLLSVPPDASSKEITARLLETVDDISAENPFYKGLLGSGRVNAFKAIRESFEGRTTLDSEYYSCSDVVHIEVLDFDLIGQVIEQVSECSTQIGLIKARSKVREAKYFTSLRIEDLKIFKPIAGRDTVVIEDDH